MGRVAKGLEDNARELGCKKADFKKIPCILKISKPAEGPVRLFMLVSDTCRAELWMEALGQCGEGAG